MKYLLDTHVWLWWVLDPQLLSERARAVITNPQIPVFLSSASTWEATIKCGTGRLRLPGGPQQFIRESYQEDGFLPLPILFEHTSSVFDLPALHRDPFDRLLISQALCENALLITSDPLVKQYPVRTIDPQT